MEVNPRAFYQVRSLYCGIFGSAGDTLKATMDIQLGTRVKRPTQIVSMRADNF